MRSSLSDPTQLPHPYCTKTTEIMVLTIRQTISFFEDTDQMAIPHETRIQLQQEGIDYILDYLDFDGEALRQVAENSRRPGGRVPNFDPNAKPGSTMPTPPFVFGAKS